MQPGISGTIRAVAVLASLAWANRAVARAPQAITVQSDLVQTAEDNIRAILVKPFSGKIDRRPLTEVLASLKQSTNLPLFLDRQSLEDASIAVDTPVSCDVSNLPLHTALSLMLDRSELVWTIHDQYVWVTTPDKAGSLIIIKVYPVLDLALVSDGRNPATNYQPLVDTIKAAVAPAAWDEVGGPGGIVPFVPSGSLVIGQTFEVHEEIALLLTRLRQARDMQHIAPDALRQRRHASHHRREPEPAESFGPPPYHIVPPPNVGMGGGMF